MQDKELYEKLLGLEAPWHVSNVDLQMEDAKVTVRLEHDALARFPVQNAARIVRAMTIENVNGDIWIPVALLPSSKPMYRE